MTFRVENRKRIYMTKEDYLLLPHKNFSTVKSIVPELKNNVKIKFGSIIDAIILGEKLPEQDNIEGLDQYEIAVAAREILKFLKKFENQIQEKHVKITANYTNGFLTLPVKGEIDMLTSDAVIEVKTTSVKKQDFQKLVKKMKYHYQLAHYTWLANKTLAFWLVYFRKEKSVELVSFDKKMLKETNDFWHECILLYGN